VGRRRPLLLPAALALVAPIAAAQAPRPSPTPRPAAKQPRATTVPPKRVFTNDDLDEARKRPSAVQDLQAKEGTVGYEHADGSTEPSPAYQPTPEPTQTFEEQQQQQIAAAEEQVRQLDARAKELLWQQLQSTDTYEIMRLKQEQQEVLNQLEAAKAELARVRGEAPAPGAPTPEPTRQPG